MFILDIDDEELFVIFGMLFDLFYFLKGDVFVVCNKYVM